MSQMYSMNNTMPNKAQDIPIWIDLLFMAVILFVAVVFAVNYLNVQRQITSLENDITTANKEINTLTKNIRNEIMTLWDVQTAQFKLYAQNTGLRIPEWNCIVQMNPNRSNVYMLAGKDTLQKVPHQKTVQTSISTIIPPQPQVKNISATNN